LNIFSKLKETPDSAFIIDYYEMILFG